MKLMFDIGLDVICIPFCVCVRVSDGGNVDFNVIKFV